MGVIQKCCQVDDNKDNYISMDHSPELILPTNLSIQDVIEINKNPSYLKINNKRSKSKENLMDESLSKLKSFKLKVFACYDEQFFPIWFEKGAFINFKVYGKWSLYNKVKSVSSFGDTTIDEKIYDCNVGALMGRIQGGPVFQINNDFEYIAPCKGCLYLFQNNGLYETNPSGFLDVEVIGGRKYSFEEIERLSKWPYNNLMVFNENLTSPQEKDLIYLINKMRYDPELFCEYYLNHMASLSIFHENACREIINAQRHNTQFSRISHSVSDLSMKKSFKNNEFDDQANTQISFSNNRKPVLIYNHTLKKICDDRLVSKKDIDIQNPDYKIDEDKSLQDALNKSGLEYINYCEICTYGKSSSLGIMYNLLINDDQVDNSTNREVLVSGQYTHIGISIKEHSIYSWSCSIILAVIIDGVESSN